MDANSRDVGFLVVGAGYWGSRRASAIARARGARLVAVVDVDDDTARAVAERHGARPISDLTPALDVEEIQAVVVATPHHEHAPQVRQALEAGKHVLCEKPLAIHTTDARRLAMLADEQRLRLATGFNHRFMPPIDEALGLVRTWAIGRVESVRVQIGHRASGPFLRSWHTEVERSGGGTLLDNGVHACDLIRRFVGEIVAAQGYVRHALGLPEGCESEAFALFRNHDRAVAELRSSWTLEAGYLTLDVRGSDGFLHVETAPWRLSGVLANGRAMRRSYHGPRAIERLHERRFGCDRSLVREVEAFVEAIRDRPREGASGWDGCRATEMAQAVYESARTGREVVLEPPLVHLPSLARRRALMRRTA